MKFSRNAVTQTNHKPLFGSSLKGRIRQSRGNSPDLRIDPPPIGDPYAHCSDRSPSCPVDLQCSRLRSGRIPNLTLACPSHADAQSSETSSAQEIQNWVEQLEDDRFAVREIAQQQLSRQLSSILPKLIELAEAPQSSTSNALLQFLGFVSQDALSQQGKAAFESLNRIVRHVPGTDFGAA